MRAPPGSIISYATQPGGVASDALGHGRDSPYTTALAEALPAPGLEVVRAFNNVGLRVSEETNSAQEPWLALAAIPGEFNLARRHHAGLLNAFNLASSEYRKSRVRAVGGRAVDEHGWRCGCVGTTHNDCSPWGDRRPGADRRRSPRHSVFRTGADQGAAGRFDPGPDHRADEARQRALPGRHAEGPGLAGPAAATAAGQYPAAVLLSCIDCVHRPKSCSTWASATPSTAASPATSPTSRCWAAWNSPASWPARRSFW